MNEHFKFDIRINCIGLGHSQVKLGESFQVVILGLNQENINTRNSFNKNSFGYLKNYKHKMHGNIRSHVHFCDIHLNKSEGYGQSVSCNCNY